MRSHIQKSNRSLGLCASAFAGLSALTVTSCNFSRFDDLRGAAPIQQYSDPFDGAQFPLVIAGIPAGTGGGLVAASSNRSVAKYVFGADGDAAVSKFKQGAQITIGSSQITALAGSSAGDFMVATGDVAGDRRAIYIDTNGNTGASAEAPNAAPKFGTGAALADVHRLAGAATSGNDMVVISSHDLFVFPENGIASGMLIRCMVRSTPTAEETATSVAAGDLFPTAGADSPAEVAVGVTATAGGSVGIYNVSGKALSTNAAESNESTVACATGPSRRLISAPAGEASFGTRVVIANVIGDAALDLVVSAPEQNKVFVYEGPIGLAPTPAVTLTAPAATGSFGAALAAVDLDGTGIADIAVGDPSATVEGEASAGQVVLYNMGGSNRTNPTATLNDGSPSAGALFGRTVAGARFGASKEQLAVGAVSGLYVFFNTGAAGDVDDRE